MTALLDDDGFVLDDGGELAGEGCEGVCCEPGCGECEPGFGCAPGEVIRACTFACRTFAFRQSYSGGYEVGDTPPFLSQTSFFCGWDPPPTPGESRDWEADRTTCHATENAGLQNGGGVRMRCNIAACPPSPPIGYSPGFNFPAFSIAPLNPRIDARVHVNPGFSKVEVHAGMTSPFGFVNAVGGTTIARIRFGWLLDGAAPQFFYEVVDEGTTDSVVRPCGAGPSYPRVRAASFALSAADESSGCDLTAVVHGSASYEAYRGLGLTDDGCHDCFAPVYTRGSGSFTARFRFRRMDNYLSFCFGWDGLPDGLPDGFPDGAAVSAPQRGRWLGADWIGLPYPKRLWRWALAPDHPKPSSWPGCGCLAGLKDWWRRRRGGCGCGGRRLEIDD